MKSERTYRAASFFPKVLLGALGLGLFAGCGASEEPGDGSSGTTRETTSGTCLSGEKWSDALRVRGNDEGTGFTLKGTAQFFYRRSLEKVFGWGDATSRAQVGYFTYRGRNWGPIAYRAEKPTPTQYFPDGRILLTVSNRSGGFLYVNFSDWSYCPERVGVGLATPPQILLKKGVGLRVLFDDAPIDPVTGAMVTPPYCVPGTVTRNGCTLAENTKVEVSWYVRDPVVDPVTGKGSACAPQGEPEIFNRQCVGNYTCGCDQKQIIPGPYGSQTEICLAATWKKITCGSYSRSSRNACDMTASTTVGSCKSHVNAVEEEMPCFNSERTPLGFESCYVDRMVAVGQQPVPYTCQDGQWKIQSCAALHRTAVNPNDPKPERYECVPEAGSAYGHCYFAQGGK
jgi:hypothetical protein